jgi:hypothetical protein
VAAEKMDVAVVQIPLLLIPGESWVVAGAAIVRHKLMPFGMAPWEESAAVVGEQQLAETPIRLMLLALE